MHAIIMTLLIIVLLLAAVRLTWWFLCFLIEHPIAIVALVAVWFVCGQHEERASDYRAAATAVERATGKPCDYACKVMIATNGADRNE